MEKNYFTYYELLGVETNATVDEILKAYKEKAKEFHPDKNDGHHTATKLFQYLQDAKDVLTNPKQREEYDYLAGIKQRPEPEPQIIRVPVKEKSNNTDTVIAVGAIALLVGIFIGVAGGSK